MEKSKKEIIGVSGLARSGKNLFADVATDILKQNGKTTKCWALAYYLKQDCEEFIKKNLDLSVWSEKNEEKNVFRDLLVWYGDAKRKMSEGRFWIDQIQKDLNESTADVNIVTDIRYTTYPKDECYWIQKEMGGKLIHLAKYTFDKSGNKVFDLPPNKHEEHNDPILQKCSDFNIEWLSVRLKYNGSYIAMLADPYVREIVTNTLVGCGLIK